MSLAILKAGLQTSIQAAPRRGLRHLGIPAAGPADPLSQALANRLVGNTLLAPALEVTLVGPRIRFEQSAAFAITGAKANVQLSDRPVEFHQTLVAHPGDELSVASVETGARLYIAVAGGLAADHVLGSASTYMPAALGGYAGRALQDGDVINLQCPEVDLPTISTPSEFQPPITDHWMLRACRSAETHLLADGQRSKLFESSWTIGRRADRMGLQLDGRQLIVHSSGRMSSAAVFPGTIQCPEDGKPYLLCVDAQTIGGYPRVAQVTRADRHLLGQMRPGDRLQLLPRQPVDAISELRAKHDYWRKWLPGIESII